MRPQHITAENGRPGAGGRAARQASMRPQHITAENLEIDPPAGVSPALLQ